MYLFTFKLNFFQAIQLPVSSPTFANSFVELLFHPEYMAVRSWPTTYGRSNKPKMPMQIRSFMQSYIARHVQDKMDAKAFLNAYVHLKLSVYIYSFE